MSLPVMFPPECVMWHCHLTVNRILVDCIEYAISDLFCLTTMLHKRHTIIIMCLQLKSSHLSKELDCTTHCNSFIVLFFLNIIFICLLFSVLVGSGFIWHLNLLVLLSDTFVYVSWQLP